ncbi:hypothetical protein FACS1894132_00210 [Clostridia bacterium]|nr:hypothetical protein FACS1894132_00210 [Clostridia bacterium]
MAQTKKMILALITCIMLVGCGDNLIPQPENSETTKSVTTAENITTDTATTSENIVTDVTTSEINNPGLNASEILKKMSLEEKVAQLFFVDDRVAKEDISKVGGFYFYRKDLPDEKSASDFIKSINENAVIPLFFATDEEGGIVDRVSQLPNAPKTTSAYDLNGDTAKALSQAKQIGSYLENLGLNVDFAPVADVWTNPANTVIGKRSFSSDPAICAKMVEAYIDGLHSEKMLTTAKHFPGHGDTKEDSHEGSAYTYKTLEEIEQTELIPFKAAIANGVDFIMTGHITAPEADSEPASLSAFWHSYLRNELGFKGIIVTDALGMGAVSTPPSSETAVKALLAGADMLLSPVDFKEALSGVINAVNNGTISEQRIDESVLRIVQLKSNKGLMGVNS